VETEAKGNSAELAEEEEIALIDEKSDSALGNYWQMV
jgi:hypothetical protein